MKKTSPIKNFSMKTGLSPSLRSSLHWSLHRTGKVAYGGAPSRANMVALHVISHMFIAFAIFGGLYLMYVSQDLHNTNCFAWYSSLMAVTRRTPVQNLYCDVVTSIVSTVSNSIGSITKAKGVHAFANIFGVLFSLVVGYKTTSKIFKVYNAKIMQMTCAIIGMNYSETYANGQQELDAANADLCNLVDGMIKNVAAASVPAAVATTTFSISSLMSAISSAPKATRAASPRAASPRAASPITDDMQRELEAALNEISSSDDDNSPSGGKKLKRPVVKKRIVKKRVVKKRVVKKIKGGGE